MIDESKWQGKQANRAPPPHRIHRGLNPSDAEVHPSTLAPTSTGGKDSWDSDYPSGPL